MQIFSKDLLMASGEKDFVRPNLSANGTLGGNAFAVGATDNYAFRAVDGNSSTYWSATGSSPRYIFYNPNSLKVTQLKLNFTATTYWATNVTLQGSDDGSSWTTIPSNYVTQSSGVYGTLSVNSQNYFKYHRLALTPANSNRGVRLTELEITATYKG